MCSTLPLPNQGYKAGLSNNKSREMYLNRRTRSVFAFQKLPILDFARKGKELSRRGESAALRDLGQCQGKLPSHDIDRETPTLSNQIRRHLSERKGHINKEETVKRTTRH